MPLEQSTTNDGQEVKEWEFLVSLPFGGITEILIFLAASGVKLSGPEVMCSLIHFCGFLHFFILLLIPRGCFLRWLLNKLLMFESLPRACFWWSSQLSLFRNELRAEILAVLSIHLTLQIEQTCTNLESNFGWVNAFLHLNSNKFCY